MFVNKAIFFVILSIFIYALIAIFTDFSEFISNLQSLDLSYLPLILFLVMISLVLKALRQFYLLKKLDISIPFLENFKIFLAGLSMLITPGGTGELVKSHLIKQNFDESISKTAPVVFIERFQDFLGILGMLLITIIFISSTGAILAIVGSSIILSLISAIIIQKKILMWIQKKIKKISFLQKLFSRDQEFYNSLYNLFKPTPMLISFVISLAGIFLDGAAMYFSLISIIPEIGIFESIQKSFTSVVIGLFSLLPAGVGVTEISLLSLISKNGISESTAASAVIYLRLTTLWFMTGLGFIFLKVTYRK
jgi:uncharacterized protein (TIRG00374 family)